MANELINQAEPEEQPNILEDVYSIKVSVRQLVEFILRSGNIDNRRSSSVEDAMTEGSRLHRMIQKKMGDNYYAEVQLRFRYETSRYVIDIEGRADGIIMDGLTSMDIPMMLENGGDSTWKMLKDNDLLKQDLININDVFDLTVQEYEQVTIDEIKCVARSLEYVTEPVPVHLAQAKVYAYIYARQQKLPVISVRMSYCNMETEEMKYFDFKYSFSELHIWFEALMKEYIKWTDFEYDWHVIKNSSIKQLQFPFEYREGQRQLAVYVYQTIREKKKLYLEAPTGVGKTISTVFPAVKGMGEGITDKIFYLTAKTITRTVAEDTFELLRNNGLKMKTVTITAKEKICPCEKKECNPVNCERANGHFDRINEAIYQAITMYDRIDRGVIETIALEHNVCPFELGLDISLFADSIICDYNYVFDPHASLKRYFSEGMEGNYTFLIDEAHNLVERGRSMYSAVLYKEDLLSVKRVLTDALANNSVERSFKQPSLVSRLIKALERCNKEMLAIRKVCDGCIELEDIDSFAGLVESLYSVMNQFLEEESDSAARQIVLDYFFEISHFLLIYEKMDKYYTIYAEILDDGSFLVKLLCVNPRNNLISAMSKGRSSILFSATLLPIQYYKNLLGGEETDYEVYAKSTFDNSKRGLFIANDVTSKYTRRGILEYNRIASYIYEISRAKKGNYMVFFPSHAFLASVYEQFMECFYTEQEFECMIQEEHMTEEMREQFLKEFENSHTEKSLVGFCVLGGIFSEGIDLKNDSLIGAIIVGTGLPQVCNERELLKDAFDDENADGFDYSYRYPGMNKVLQAAGRVIRTAEDVGIVALLDERFLSNQNKRMFPREWDNFKIVSNTNVSNAISEFWKKHE